MSGILVRASFGNEAIAHSITAPAQPIGGVDRKDEIAYASDGLEVRFDGRLHDRAELCAALGIGGAESKASSDASLVASGYRTWGADCCSRLIGEFAFVLRDNGRSRLLCARDAMGVRPLHWARTDGALVVATRVSQALEQAGVSAEPDSKAAIRYLALDFSDLEATAFRQVRRLAPGHRLVADDRGVRTERYWKPDPNARTELRRDADMVERFAEIFERAVRDRLPERGGAAVLLSGGFDSSSVAVQARALRAAVPSEFPLRAATITFPTLDSCDESEFVAALEDDALEVERFPADLHSYLDAGLHPPLDTPFLGWESAIESAFKDLSQRGTATVLTGYGGDGLLIGTARTYAEALRKGDLRVLSEMARHARRHRESYPRLVWNLGLKPLVPERLRSMLRPARERPNAPLPPWIPDDQARRAGLAVAGGRRTGGDSARERIRRAALDDGHLDLCLDWLDRRGRAVGLELSHPYLDRRLVEFVLSLPPRMLFRGGRRKWILLEAMAGLLPEPIRARTTKTMLSTFWHRSMRSREGASVLRGAFRRPLAAEAGWVDGEALLDGCESYLNGEDRWGAHLWTALTLELWLRAHADRLGLSSAPVCSLPRHAPLGKAGEET